MFGTPDLANGLALGLFEFPELEEWGEKELLRKEKETLGFYITGHPLNEFISEIKDITTCTIHALVEQEDKSQVKIAGVMEDCKIKRTRRGDKMAIIRIEDLTGSAEVIIFPELFSAVSHLLKGDDPLFITGTAESGDNTAKIIAQEIVTLSSVRQKFIRAVELNINCSNISKELLEDLKDIVFRFPGSCKLLFNIELPRKEAITVEAHNYFNILPCDEFIAEIESAVGSKVNRIGLDTENPVIGA